MIFQKDCKLPLVCTIIGIRPDIIRMSKVFEKLDQNKYVQHCIIHTGQHYDDLLSDVFFRDLKLRRPDFNLECSGGNHYEQLAKLTPFLLEKLKYLNPALVVYLGDSNSVLTAPSVRKQGFKIAHIEAGMRSDDMRMLEEINRKVCDAVSNLHFVYHENYAEKLRKENVSSDGIYIVGNTIVEPIQRMIQKLILDYLTQTHITDWQMNSENWLSKFRKGKHILVDIHRPENFNDRNRIKMLLKFFKYCSEKYSCKLKMINFPRAMGEFYSVSFIEDPSPPGKKITLDKWGVEVVPLMSYEEYIYECLNSKFIISDSGTAQEELAFLNKKVIVPRDYTERSESIKHNCSRLLSLENINPIGWDNITNWATDYGDNTNVEWMGDGRTSEKIVNIIEAYLLDDKYYMRF